MRKASSRSSKNTTDDDAHGCLLYLSMTEYLTIDQTLGRIMSRLGFEVRR
jgi:hypothetical protein